MRQIAARVALAAALLVVAAPVVYFVGNLLVKTVVGLLVVIAAYRLVRPGLAERDA